MDSKDKLLNLDSGYDWIVEEELRLQEEKLDDITRYNKNLILKSRKTKIDEDSQRFFPGEESEFFGSLTSALFIAAGIYTLLTSLNTVKMSIPYTLEETYIDIELHETMYAPIFVQKQISGYSILQSFYQMQPSYFGPRYDCSGLEKAGDFCKLNPFMAAPKLGGQGFCDLDPENIMNPCGLYTLFINLDDIELELIKHLGLDELSKYDTRGKSSPGSFYFLLNNNANSTVTSKSSPNTPPKNETYNPSKFLHDLFFNFNHIVSEDSNKIEYRPKPHTSVASEHARDNSEIATNKIPITKDPKALLSEFQYNNVYTTEQKVVQEHINSHPNEITWLDPGDLTWFFWRRPTLNNDISIPLGRIDVSLMPGIYRLHWIINEFPEGDNFRKNIEFLSNVQVLGSRQFVASILCFIVGNQ